MNHLKRYRYKNLTLLIISFIAAYLLAKFEPFHNFLLNLGSFGLMGAFVGGALFVSTLTISIGAVILLVLAQSMDKIPLSIVAGFGAVGVDFIVFKFVKDKLVDEITPIYNSIGGSHLTKILHTKYFRWSLPVIGAIIIASPFPDELGVSLLGIAKLKNFQFLILSLLLNIIGIFIVLSASSIIKP